MIATAVLMFASSAMAQNGAPNFSGTWTLDTARSKMQMPVESMTLTVAQTEAEITVTTATKRPAPPADAPQRGGGMGRGGMMGGGGDGTTTYALNGKDTTMKVQGPMGEMPVALKAKMDGGKLKLSQSRTFNSPMGEVSMTTKETWEMNTDGTLTVTRETETPRGSMSSTMVFTKLQK